MNVLVVIQYGGHFSNFSSHLPGYLNGTGGKKKVTVTTVMPPYYSCYSKTGKMLNKKQLVVVMFFNFFYFLYAFVLKEREKYNVIILDSHVVAVPFLFLVKIFPFVNAEKNIIVMSFFLHTLSEKKIIQKILRFVLKGKKVLMSAQSEHEVEYYSQLMGKTKVVHFPFCQHEVSISEACGRGEEYIFAGGYTNRDYECLFEAARKINHNFIIISSKLNQTHLAQKPDNVKILSDRSHADFHGYLKNSKIVVIPLKEKTGSSGQKVALAAMLFKKPIIYTDIDSISQYFEPGLSGIRYQINNAEELADKIHYLLSEPQLREKLGANAYETYCKKYHISKYCEFLADLITDSLPARDGKVAAAQFTEIPGGDVQREPGGNK